MSRCGLMACETIAGDLDLDSLVSLRPEYGSFDLERLVGLQPQLIVNDMWEHPPDFWGLEAEMVEQIETISPIANVLFVERPMTDTLACVAQLAAALGADLAAPQVVADKAAFDTAVAELQHAIDSKPGLTVAFVSGRPEESFWVGNPLKLADLYFYQEVGPDIGQPDDKEHFSEELSWEQAGSIRPISSSSTTGNGAPPARTWWPRCRPSPSSPPPEQVRLPPGPPSTFPATAA